MNTAQSPITVKGKSLGVAILVAAQLLVGIVHIVFGLWLLSAASIVPLFGSDSIIDIYSVYTTIFGLLTLLFAVGLWWEKPWSWIGTVGVAVFVIVADVLTLLDLPSIPGVPKFTGFGEITYSLLVLIYLSQTYVRAKYKIIKS